MERNQKESFADYKIRRAAANKAVKLINYIANHGGKVGTREQLRNTRASQRQRGIGFTRSAYKRPTH